MQLCMHLINRDQHPGAPLRATIRLVVNDLSPFICVVGRGGGYPRSKTGLRLSVSGDPGVSAPESLRDQRFEAVESGRKWGGWIGTNGGGLSLNWGKRVWSSRV